MKYSSLSAAIVIALAIGACSTQNTELVHSADTPSPEPSAQAVAENTVLAQEYVAVPTVSSPSVSAPPDSSPPLSAAAVGAAQGAVASNGPKRPDSRVRDDKVVVNGSRIKRSEVSAAAPAMMGDMVAVEKMYAPASAYPNQSLYQQENTERYEHANDNAVIATASQPVSTFGLDVDSGAYSNVRRFLRQGQMPPADAVRVEELINYFSYQDARAESGHPFGVQTEIAPAPWNSAHQLLRVRIKAMDTQSASLPPVNLVFLVDVSGSMDEPDKLPLVQASLNLLVDQLRPVDRISLVVYAGRTQVELPPTSGDQKSLIRAAINRLQAGGSTAGGAAIELAYAQAKQGFRAQGINRILLATDGDFNVGITDNKQLKDLVAKQRDSGVTLTTLGFGQGNYNDAMMEQIADVGNGNYAYIDSADEARKVLVDEMHATLNTVAKDAKIQIEFNPATVAEYRLIGYENRLLNEADFNNDKIDAGDVGAGKSVTALYELTPVGAQRLIDAHRYAASETSANKNDKAHGNELAFLRIRYKPHGVDQSVLLEKSLLATEVLGTANKASEDFRFAAAVAGFGQLLRHSPYIQNYGYRDVAALARSAMTQDAYGYRAEFVRLNDIAASLSARDTQVNVGMNE